MKIATACPYCGRRYQIAVETIGKRVKCKACGEPFRVVAADEQLETPAAAPWVPPPIQPSVARAKGPLAELLRNRRVVAGAGGAVLLLVVAIVLWATLGVDEDAQRRTSDNSPVASKPKKPSTPVAKRRYDISPTGARTKEPPHRMGITIAAADTPAEAWKAADALQPPLSEDAPVVLSLQNGPFIAQPIDGRYTLWDLRSGESRTFDGPAAHHHIVLSPDGQYLLTVTDEALVITSTATGASHEVQTQWNYPMAVCDGQVVCGKNGEKTLKLFTLRTGAASGEIAVHDPPVNLTRQTTAASPEGRVVFYSGSRFVPFVDVVARKYHGGIGSAEIYAPRAIALTRDGRHLICAFAGDEAAEVHVVETVLGQRTSPMLIPRMLPDPLPLQAFAGGQTLILGSSVIDYDTEHTLADLSGVLGDASVQLQIDERRVLVSGKKGGTRIVDLPSTIDAARTVARAGGHPDDVGLAGLSKVGGTPAREVDLAQLQGTWPLPVDQPVWGGRDIAPELAKVADVAAAQMTQQHLLIQRPGEAGAAEIARLELSSGKPLATVQLGERFRTLSISPGGQRLLAGNAAGPLGRLDLFDLESGAQELTPTASWRPLGVDARTTTSITSAWLLSDTLALVRDDGGWFTAWELPASAGMALKPLWKLQAPAAIAPAFSANGRYVALALENDVAIIESATGKVLHRLDPQTSVDAGALSFDPLTKHLALIGKFDHRSELLQIWSLADGSLTHALPLVGKEKARHVAWLSSQHVMAGSYLCDMKAHRVVWQYLGDYRPVDGAPSDGRLWYVSRDTGGPSGALAAVALPHEQAAPRDGTALPPAPVLLGRGTTASVDIRVSPPGDSSKWIESARAHIAGGLRSAGVEVRDGAPVKVILSTVAVDDGQPQEYADNPYSPNRRMIVKVQKTALRLTVVDEQGQAAWIVTSDTAGRTPLMLHYREGEDVNVRLQREMWEKLTAELFRMRTPQIVLRRESLIAPQQSTLTADGRAIPQR